MMPSRASEWRAAMVRYALLVLDSSIELAGNLVTSVQFHVSFRVSDN